MAFTAWDSIKECLLGAVFSECLTLGSLPPDIRAELGSLLDEMQIEGPERFRLEQLLRVAPDPFQASIYQSELETALLLKPCRRLALRLASHLEERSGRAAFLWSRMGALLRTRAREAGRDRRLLHRGFAHAQRAVWRRGSGRRVPSVAAVAALNA